ncbi:MULTISPECIES: hypothetical protein [unclassified Microcoleus]
MLPNSCLEKVNYPHSTLERRDVALYFQRLTVNSQQLTVNSQLL